MTPAFHAFLASARFRRATADDPDPPPPEEVTFASTDVFWSDTEITFEEAS
jgi:hypothetical protein